MINLEGGNDHVPVISSETDKSECTQNNNLIKKFVVVNTRGNQTSKLEEHITNYHHVNVTTMSCANHDEVSEKI